MASRIARRLERISYQISKRVGTPSYPDSYIA